MGNKSQTEKRGAFYKMEVAGRKLMFVALALVLVIATFPTEARKLDGADGKDDSSTPPKHLHYGMLPKGTPVPPSGPSKKSSSSPPPPHHRLGTVSYGLHRGPVPPSAPNGPWD